MIKYQKYLFKGAFLKLIESGLDWSVLKETPLDTGEFGRSSVSLNIRKKYMLAILY